MANGFEYKKNDFEYKAYLYDREMVLVSEDKKTQSLFNEILSVFDKNNDKSLDSNEIKNIWDEIFYNQENSVDIDKDGVINNGEAQALIEKSSIFKKLKLTSADLINFLGMLNDTITTSFAKSYANTTKTLPEKLKAQYPQAKYNIKMVADNQIEIVDKNDNKPIMTCRIFDNGSYLCEYFKDNQPIKNERYDSSGNLKTTSIAIDRGGCIEWIDTDPISEALYNDVTAKTKLGFCTTGKDIEKHIQQITPENVCAILVNYENRYGESLLEAIDGEWGLDDDVKTRIKAHLNKCIAESSTWQAAKPNTRFDKDFDQGLVGDCGFLASIAAIKRSPKGLEILNNTIKDNGDGTYTVKFKGADEGYTVTALEILSKGDYANGDLDVRILEIAAEKHYFTGISGGSPALVLDLLLGSKDIWKNLGRACSPKPNKEKIAELLKNPNIVVTAAINPFSKLFGIIFNAVDDKAEYKNEIGTAHAYAIVGIDDNNIYLKNPWHTDQNIAIPLDVFDDYWACVQYVEVE